LINSIAARNSSLGIRRFFDGIMRHLAWPQGIELTAAPRVAALARVRELLMRGRPDAILWSPGHRGPLNAAHHVLTVHDCINVDYYRGDWRLPIYRRLFQEILTRAQVIAPISQATRAALLRNYRVDPAKIAVIKGGIDWPAIGSAGSHESTRTDPPFVLMVTNSLPHKNTTRACRAFAASSAVNGAIALRVVGSVTAEGISACQRAGVRLELPGRVDDRTLYEWYRSCAFLYSPSLDEGYDLPIAEALAAGANVLCSDIEVHRELYGDRVRLFDPLNLEAMISAVEEAIRSEGSWYPELPAGPLRTYREVAADYAALFTKMDAEA
jgi:glycosyltransferase involved in cell wall biosynthesis